MPDHYYCVAPSQTKCYDTGLDQCDFCQWKSQMKESEMLPQSDSDIETGLSLGQILEIIMRNRLRDPTPSRSTKRRAKIYNKAIDDAIEAIKWRYHDGVSYTGPGQSIVSDLEALKKTV